LTIEETLDKPGLTNNDVALVVHRPVESPATSACEEDDGRRMKERSEGGEELLPYTFLLT